MAQEDGFTRLNMIYIHNTTLYTPSETIERGALLASDGIITAIGNEDEIPCPTGAQPFDAEGLILSPGFIDLQINGAFGMDFTTHPETIWQVGERLIQFGVTSFLPTIVSSPLETIRQAQAVLQIGPPTDYHGARVIGLHLEGPYINPERRGAHNPAYISLPDQGVYKQWSPANHVRLVTLAPELVGSIPAIQTLFRNGVAVSAGHSQATLSQAQAGFDAGIRYGTHLFNAMPPLDHRQPGLVGALLGNPVSISGMVIDGIHLHPVMVSLAWTILGAQRTNLVTDAMAALGMPQGKYQLGDRTVFVDSSTARLEDGRLAGSLLSLDQALRNLIAFTGCSLPDALHTVTQGPAHLLHLEISLGSLTIGSKADLVLLTPENHVVRVWINGQPIFLPCH
jgi:N-acetylglucosamine-6-phosphate deacetylase